MSIDERLKYLNKEILKLQNEQRELLKKDDEDFQKRAKVNVGRCFYDSSTKTYIKVIDVPQTKSMMWGEHMNRYQYPAIFVGNDVDDNVPFYSDTLFSGIWGEGNDMFKKHQEISEEEFDTAFTNALDSFRKYILSIHKKEA